jgi:Uma2 family endonuclease
MNMVTLNLAPVLYLNYEQFNNLVRANPEAKLELTAEGKLVAMSPTGGETGERNSCLNAQVWLWNNQSKQGKVFDSSTGFRLPNKAIRSPDVSWISLSRWNSLSTEQRQKFPPIVPDFVIELRSPTDDLCDLQDKMQEYMDNGARLGLLIDPIGKKVEIYPEGKAKEVLLQPALINCENVLPGFVLDLGEIWGNL